MSIQRQYERWLDQQNYVPRKTRGAPRQFGRHIIKKGLRDMKPIELHATKGWRRVPAWT